MPQPPECWMCGKLELRIVRAPYPADDARIPLPVLQIRCQGASPRTERDKSR
jgi:hypothetical protein